MTQPRKQELYMVCVFCIDCDSWAAASHNRTLKEAQVELKELGKTGLPARVQVQSRYHECLYPDDCNDCWGDYEEARAQERHLATSPSVN